MTRSGVLGEWERLSIARGSDGDIRVPQGIAASHRLPGLREFVVWDRRPSESVACEFEPTLAPIEVDIQERDGFIDSLEEVLDPVIVITSRQRRIPPSCTRDPIVQLVGQ